MPETPNKVFEEHMKNFAFYLWSSTVFQIFLKNPDPENKNQVVSQTAKYEKMCERPRDPSQQTVWK